MSAEALRLWTVGHSNHSFDGFLELLGGHGVESVVDVRSEPYPSYSTHFCRAPLRRSLIKAGLSYLFLGRELGGRPPEPKFYDEDGHVLYDKLAGSGRFGEGLRRLVDGSARFRVAVMCSEEDPTYCHRRQLIARALRNGGSGVSVLHIRGTGETVDESQLERDERTGQLGLLGDQTAWRSRMPARGARLGRRGASAAGPRRARIEGRAVAAGAVRGFCAVGVEICTIGFTKPHSAESFFGALRDEGVKRLLDVRLNNSSQLAGFAKCADLEFFLSELCEAEYLHEPRLLAPTEQLLKAYRSKELSWPQYEERFLDLMARRSIETEISPDMFDERTALLCSEHTAERCHRRLIVEYLDQRWGGVAAVHLPRAAIEN